MIVTENGFGAIDYYRWRRNDGLLSRSARDMVSTHERMVKRYVLIYVDREEFGVKNCDCYRKDSFYWYKKF